MLLAYADAAYASRCGRHFRQLGWEVLIVASGIEARKLAHESCPDVVVLDVALLDQSGWLTRAKPNLEKSNSRIILVANRQTADIETRRRTIGAEEIVCREDGAEALASAVFGAFSYAEAV